MGLAKKGSRRIVVDGQVYRWTLSPDDEPGIAIVVEKAADPGQRLVSWVQHDNTISPWMVRAAILKALQEGWQPERKGKPFDSSLPGTQLTPEKLASRLKAKRRKPLQS